MAITLVVILCFLAGLFGRISPTPAMLKPACFLRTSKAPAIGSSDGYGGGRSYRDFYLELAQHVFRFCFLRGSRASALHRFEQCGAARGSLLFNLSLVEL